MADHLIVGVNGYGAAKTPETDGNTTRYMDYVLDFCRWHDVQAPEGHVIVYNTIELHLLGGNTNRDSMTEAGALARWLQVHGLPRNVISVTLHEQSTDLRGNLESMAKVTQPGSKIRYFCETSRRPATVFLAHALLPERELEILGVAFDADSMRLGHRLRQLGPKLWLEVAALKIGGPFEQLRQYLRARHIAKHRRLAGEEP